MSFLERAAPPPAPPTRKPPVPQTSRSRSNTERVSPTRLRPPRSALNVTIGITATPPTARRKPRSRRKQRPRRKVKGPTPAEKLGADTLERIGTSVRLADLPTLGRSACVSHAWRAAFGALLGTLPQRVAERISNLESCERMRWLLCWAERRRATAMRLSDGGLLREVCTTTHTPCTRHAHAMHTPCTYAIHASRHGRDKCCTCCRWRAAQACHRAWANVSTWCCGCAASSWRAQRKQTRAQALPLPLPPYPLLLLLLLLLPLRERATVLVRRPREWSCMISRCLTDTPHAWQAQQGAKQGGVMWRGCWPPSTATCPLQHVELSLPLMLPLICASRALMKPPWWATTTAGAPLPRPCRK